MYENINSKQRAGETESGEKGERAHKRSCQSEFFLHKLVCSRVQFCHWLRRWFRIHGFGHKIYAWIAHNMAKKYADFYQVIVYLIKLVASEIKSSFITCFYYGGKNSQFDHLLSVIIQKFTNTVHRVIIIPIFMIMFEHQITILKVSSFFFWCLNMLLYAKYDLTIVVAQRCNQCTEFILISFYEAQ